MNEKPLPQWLRITCLVSILAICLFMLLPEADAAPTRMSDFLRGELNYTIGNEARQMSQLDNIREHKKYLEGLLCANGEQEYCPAPVEPIKDDAGAVTVATRTFLGTYGISRYYSPVEGQDMYYYKTYAQDYKINCQGDCMVTADGYHLDKAKPFTVAACPPNMEFGTVLEIEGIGKVTCHDRGGAIKGKRIDLHAGVGMPGLENIMLMKNGGDRKVYLINE